MSVSSNTFIEMLKEYSKITKLSLTSSIIALNIPMTKEYLDSGIVIRSHNLEKRVSTLIQLSWARLSTEDVLSEVSNDELCEYNKQVGTRLFKSPIYKETLHRINCITYGCTSLSECITECMNNLDVILSIDNYHYVKSNTPRIVIKASSLTDRLLSTGRVIGKGLKTASADELEKESVRPNHYEPNALKREN